MVKGLLILVWIGLGAAWAISAEAEPETETAASLLPFSQQGESAWEALLEALESRDWTSVRVKAESVQAGSDSGPIERAGATMALAALGFTQGKGNELDPITAATVASLQGRQRDAQGSLSAARNDLSAARNRVQQLRKEREEINQQRGGELGLAFLDALTSGGRSGGTNFAGQARNVTEGKLQAKDNEILREEQQVKEAQRRVSDANAEIARITAEIDKVKKDGDQLRRVREGEFKGELLAFLGKMIEAEQFRATWAFANFYPDDPGMARKADEARKLDGSRRDAREALAGILPPIRDHLENRAFWTAGAELNGVKARLGERMRDEAFAKFVEREVAVLREKVDFGQGQVQRKVDEVLGAGRNCYREGFAKLDEIVATFPDWPENARGELRQQLAVWRKEQIEGRAKAAIAEVKQASWENPKQTWTALGEVAKKFEAEEQPEVVPLVQESQDRVLLTWVEQISEQMDKTWKSFQSFQTAYGEKLDSARDPLLVKKGNFREVEAVPANSAKQLQAGRSELDQVAGLAHGDTVRERVAEGAKETDGRIKVAEARAAQIQERQRRTANDLAVGGGLLAFSCFGTLGYCFWRRRVVGQGQSG